jgi:hypothetical protein
MVPGEIRMAITLRLLTGGSYLDLGCIFWVSSSFIYKIFAECIAWVLENFQFPLPALIRMGNWSQLKLIADQFTVKTGRILWGTIGFLETITDRTNSNDVGYKAFRKLILRHRVARIQPQRFPKKLKVTKGL